jgi:hypothetical protein
MKQAIDNKTIDMWEQKKTIKSWKLSVTWSDGKTEGLAVDLPEYLYEELQTYFHELEDLREEHDNDLRDEEYNFGEDKEVPNE